jgi:hypothetical protein
MDLRAIRERYLRDTFPKRLGALAANLARLSSFSRETPNLRIIKSLLEESEYFIEWGILDAPAELQERLVGLQIRLAVWSYRLSQGKNSFKELADEFEKYSEELLTLSGLVSGSDSR